MVPVVYGAPGMMGPGMMAPGMAMMMPPKCSRTSYVLLGIFLGCFGIHNFVAGRVGMGVAQLLITLLLGWLIVPIAFVWVWVIIEVIAVNRDGNGVQMS